MPSKKSMPIRATLKEYEFVELAGLVLKQMQFQHPQCSTNFRTISAAHEYTEAGFKYKYSAMINYEAADSQVHGTILFTESEQGDMDHRCEKKCSEFLNLFHSIAEKNVNRLKTQEPSDKFGSARWAVIPDDLTSRNPDDNFITAINDRANEERLLLGRFGDRYITVPQKITDAHAAVMGPSGAGKSTGLLIPNLIERCGTSMIVTEATNRLNEQADIFKKTAGFRKTMGHQIYWFNPTLMSSTKLNPLDVITNAEPNLRIVQAQKIAHLIVQNSHGKSGGIDSHWDKAAYLLLISLLMQIVEGIDDPKYKHIGTVLELLRLGPDQLNEYIKNSTSKRARQSFEIFFNNSTPGYARSVMVTLMPKLDAWVTPQVATLMSKSDVTPEQLSKQLFTFYLSVPSKRDDLKPLTAMILNYLLDVLDLSPLKHNLSLVLDEFTNFGYIPSFQAIYTTIRKSHVPFVLGFQDQAQLEDIYGKNKTRIILNNTATKIYNTPSPGDMVQARLISEQLGKKTESEPLIMQNCQVQMREYGRQLKTPDEVLSMGKDICIVFTSRSQSKVPPIELTKFEPAEYKWVEQKCPAPTRGDHPIDDSINYTVPQTAKPAQPSAKPEHKTKPNPATGRTGPKPAEKPSATTKPNEEPELSPNVAPEERKAEDDEDSIPSWLYG